MPALNTKRSLFGGTLRCAGVAVAAAMASPCMAELIPLAGAYSANFTSNYAIDLAGGLAVDELNSSVGGFPAPTTTNAIGAGGILQATSSSTLVSAYAYLDFSSTWSYAGASVVQYLTVDNTKTAHVYWDFSGASAPSLFEVYQYGQGDLVFELPGSVGSTDLVLLPGETYVVIIRANVNTPGTFAFAGLQWQVPAPGALVLLGIGMIGTRRRRRE